jgi:hypothetical protein
VSIQFDGAVGDVQGALVPTMRLHGIGRDDNNSRRDKRDAALRRFSGLSARPESVIRATTLEP